jgi:hypothetical protein
MKKTNLLILTAISISFLSSCNSAINPLAEKETTPLYPIRQNNKNGYINRKGEIIIPAQFDFTLPFSEGLAIVCISHEKCGYIDETGKFVINPQFKMAFRFSEGLAAVITENRLGYIDKTGNYVINPQFETFGPGGEGAIFSTFSEGLAAVLFGEKFGFVDKSGKIVINPQFEIAMPFLDGLAAIKTGNKWGFIDKGGKIIINPQFEEAQPFVNGLAAVRVGKQYGYIDKTGKIVINPQFDWANPFSDEGFAAVALNEKMGLIDKDGKYVVNPQFGHSRKLDVFLAFLITSDIGRISFSEGLMPVQIGGDSESLPIIGFADKTGKIVINPQFSEATPFYGGLAMVTFGSDREMAWIDKEGKIVWREIRTKAKTDSNSSTMNSGSNITVVNSNPMSGNTMSNSSNMTTANSAMNIAPPSSNNYSASERNGRLTTDSNIRSELNKDAASLGIHFRGARVKILEETSYEKNGAVSTWYKVRIIEYGCSVDANLGCGKNTPNDADEGWINAKAILPE